MNAERLLAHYHRVADVPDAVPRLRRFILDLAVRGKLVPQNPADQPAAELLKRIAAEKARLVKVGEVRNSPVPAASDKREPPFSIPVSWTWTHVGDIFNYDAGTKRGPKELKKDFWLVELEDIEKDTARLHERMYVHQRDSLSTKSEFRIGDILYGKLRPYLNKVLVADQVGYSTTEIVAIRPHLELSGSYCSLGFRSPFFVEYVERLGQGTKMPRLRTPDAVTAYFPLPPLAEQYRIVAKVDELMALCDRMEAARAGRESKRDRFAASSLARLATRDAEAVRGDTPSALSTLSTLASRPDQITQLRRTILDLALRGLLVKQDIYDEPAPNLLSRIRLWQRLEIEQKRIRAPRKPLSLVAEMDTPYPQPTGWAFARLGKIIYIQSGDGLTAAEMRDGKIPVFGGNGIAGYHDQKNVNKPTIVIGRVGYYCGSVHVTPPEAWVTDNAFITHFSRKELHLPFVALLLNGTNLKENENATAQPVISGSKIYPIVVGLPPLAEQHRIVAKVDELMALCDRLQASLAAAETGRSKLLEALLREALAPADVSEAA